MREWERDPPGSSVRWRAFHKVDRRWMLFVISVGLYLFWDAGYSQGCYKEGSCSGRLSNQLFHTFPRQVKQTVQENKVIIHGNGESLSHGIATQNFDGRKGTENRPSGNSGEHLIDLHTVENVAVEAAVSFEDSVLLIQGPLAWNITTTSPRGSSLEKMRCLFSGRVQTDLISVDHGFIHCKHPPASIRRNLNRSYVTVLFDGQSQTSNAVYGSISWKKVVYSWVTLEGQGDALLFVKGLSNSKRSTVPEGLECQFGATLRTKVVSFCQENVRCKLPPPHRHHEILGDVITVALNSEVFPSVARFYPLNFPRSNKIFGLAGVQWQLPEAQKPYYLCACTLVWNVAKFLREWVIYHSHLGVGKFFLYDNNSDDDLLSVIKSLQSYNVNRHPWPWLKTQEASFSDCAVRSAQECSWVAFIDLDEFIFPKSFLPPKMNVTSEPPLHAMMKQYDTENMGKLGQLKISNFNFGPSGLRTLPTSGQMLNYVCRMSAPKRVKSIVRAVALDISLCSRVHHFEIKQEYVSSRPSRTDVIIHHYKYQVWEDFKMKFVRRAATFVTDWNQKKNLDSFDRTPGLGTEAVEPPGWAHQFCEIRDTALRDYVLHAEFHVGGKMLWE